MVPNSVPNAISFFCIITDTTVDFNALMRGAPLFMSVIVDH